MVGEADASARLQQQQQQQQQQPVERLLDPVAEQQIAQHPLDGRAAVGMALRRVGEQIVAFLQAEVGRVQPVPSRLIEKPGPGPARRS